MKHIKRKFLNQFPKDVIDKSGRIFNVIELRNIDSMPVPKNQDVYLLTDQDEVIKSFTYKEKGKAFHLPEPDPILIFFNNAQGVLQQLKELRTGIFPSPTNLEYLVTDEIRNYLFSYFGLATNGIICQFLSLEALANRVIAENDKPVLQEDANRFTKLFTPEQAQRHLVFKDKLWKALPQITDKDFSAKYKSYKELIVKLEIIRNEVVHCKNEEKQKAAYNALFKGILDFPFENTLIAVKEFINFYKPNLIQTCGCGKDF